MAGTDGTRTSIGVVTVQTQIKQFRVVIDVTFLVMEDIVPTLLFMNDMLDNGLYKSVQEQNVSIGPRRQPREMENIS